MSAADIIQVVFPLGCIVALAPFLGSYMARVFQGFPPFARVESFIFRGLLGGKPAEQTWKEYSLAVVVFSVLGTAVLFAIQVTQTRLPLNPAHLPDVRWDLALNTAISFVTNTNWQAYAGEVTQSHLVQLLGLTVQNFVSAATGIGVMLALTRGLASKRKETVGNFWVDMTRSILWVLLPFSVLLAVALVSQGSPQTLQARVTATTLEGGSQTIPLGPVASQVAIKELGSNGGGFFNANSAHPFENPTPLTNMLEIIAILALPASLPFTFGRMIGSPREGRALWWTMMVLLCTGLAVSLWSETTPGPLHLERLSLEGKETRFDVAPSVLWSVATTATSNGSVNCMHDSLTPLAGLVAMLNIMLGEVIFGGVGSGMYGMLLFVLLAVFVAGLMVGRSPEYLQKKIEGFDVTMAVLGVLLPSVAILGCSALAITYARSAISNPGPHGLSQILYAFTSAAGNNGSAFAGLNCDTPFYNLMMGLAMLVGRFGVILPVLAIAGNMARKNTLPPSAGTFPTHTALFATVLISVILVIGALTFFPALSVGPIVEHLLMMNGRSF
jgi:potassium-transporting ATPase potassium-binding subunit